MNNKIALFYVLIASCLYNSSWTAAPKSLIAEGDDVFPICRTNVNNPDTAVSFASRHLFYKALRDCGYNSPERVCVINGPGTFVAFKSLDKQGTPVISFEETKWNALPIGVSRIVAYHEAMHITKKRNPNSIEEEREADHGAMSKGKCRSCALEWAKWHFDESKRRAEKEYMSLETIEKKTNKSLRELLDYIRMRSAMIDNTHPLYIERGLTAYLRLKEMSNAQCEYHHQAHVKKVL